MPMLHTAGEEVLLDHAAGLRSQLPDPWYVGLYNDETDSLQDDHTHAAITTEPAYAGPAEIRWPGDVGTDHLDSAVAGSGLYVLDITASVEFDVSGADQVVDAYYVAADFRSALLGQASAQRNLLWTGQLDAEYPLAEDATGVFPLEGVRCGLD